MSAVTGIEIFNNQRRLLASSVARIQDAVLLFLRLVNGAIFVAHGWQKVTDLPGFVRGISQLGIRPASLLGPVAAFWEFLGGFCLIFGIAVRVVAFGHAIIMVVAILAVHTPWRYGLTGDRGMEFPLAVLAASLVIVGFGKGKYSLSNLMIRS